MEVWVVIVANVESSYIKAICLTEEIAKRELFKVRDKLVKEWKEISRLNGDNGSSEDMYEEMIDNLSDDEYLKWDNYPHDCPYIYKMKVIEE
jgi:hypothetical protein